MLNACMFDADRPTNTVNTASSMHARSAIHIVRVPDILITQEILRSIKQTSIKYIVCIHMHYRLQRR
jgi:hypothetical protein